MTKKQQILPPVPEEEAGDEVSRYSARIDEIDRLIIDLLVDRFQHSRHIGALKARRGAELVDPVRVHSQKDYFVTSCGRRGLDEGMAKSLIDGILNQVISERLAQGAPPPEDHL